jgi:hypothetical protein
MFHHWNLARLVIIVVSTITVQSTASAKTIEEIEKIAQASIIKLEVCIDRRSLISATLPRTDSTTVRRDPCIGKELQANPTLSESFHLGYSFFNIGSGIITDRVGDLYTVTVPTVINKGKSINKVRITGPTGEVLQNLIVDEVSHPAGFTLLQFRSKRNYLVAKKAKPEKVKLKGSSFIAGIPLHNREIRASKGEVVAITNKYLQVDKKFVGNVVIDISDGRSYNPGAGVFNQDGELIAMHKETYNTTGPYDYIDLGWSTSVDLLSKNLASIQIEEPKTANDYFVLGNYSKVIQLDSLNFYAYMQRGLAQKSKQDAEDGQADLWPAVLADFNKALSINPQYAPSYYHRGLLKWERLKDRTGAIQDFKQAKYLFQKQGQTNNLLSMIDTLKRLGIVEI